MTFTAIFEVAAVGNVLEELVGRAQSAPPGLGRSWSWFTKFKRGGGVSAYDQTTESPKGRPTSADSSNPATTTQLTYLSGSAVVQNLCAFVRWFDWFGNNKLCRFAVVLDALRWIKSRWVGCGVLRRTQY